MIRTHFNCDSCMTCVFFKPSNYYGLGECRNHSPIIKDEKILESIPNRKWPTVIEDDWCGDFEARRIGQ
jgi:hypothetical protein